MGAGVATVGDSVEPVGQGVSWLVAFPVGDVVGTRLTTGFGSNVLGCNVVTPKSSGRKEVGAKVTCTGGITGGTVSCSLIGASVGTIVTGISEAMGGLTALV